MCVCVCVHVPVLSACHTPYMDLHREERGGRKRTFCSWGAYGQGWGVVRPASQVALVVKNPPADAGDLRDLGSIPGSGRSPEGGHGNPLQYSCLENPMDRGGWQAEIQSCRVRHNWSSCVYPCTHICLHDGVGADAMWLPFV